MKKLFVIIAFLFTGFLLAEFPIGIYMLDPDNDESHELIDQFSIKYIQRYKHAYLEKQIIEQQMENAQKHGHKVLFNLVPGPFLKEEDHMEQILAVVRKYKDHPALGMWYLFDEPTGEEMRIKLTEIYQMIKKETPDIPVALCLAWTKDYGIFKDCADYLMPDQYPVKDQEFPTAPLQHFPEFAWNMSRLGKPIIPIAQTMSWINYPTHLNKERFNAANCRLPNSTEIHYYNFSTMVQGIKGMFYYSYHDLWRAKHLQEFKETLGPKIKEFADFTKEIKGAKYSALTTPIGRGRFPAYLAASWTKENEAWLVLVNNKGEEQAGNFKLEKALGITGALKPWRDTRKTAAKVTDNSIELEKMLPWEVLIWKIEP